MILTSGNLGQFLNGERAKFFEVFDQGQAEVERYDLAEIHKSSNKIAPLVERMNAAGRQKVELTSVTGALQDLQPTGEAKPFAEDTFLPSFITSVQPYKFTKRIRISREMVEREAVEYRDKLDETGKLKSAAMRTLSHHTFDLINFARTAQASLPNYLFGYGDGEPLSSILHADQVGNNHSNCLSTSPILSVDALESMWIQGYNTVSDANQPMPMFSGPKYLIVAPANIRTAQEIAQTGNTPYIANFVANVWEGVYQVVTSNYLANAVNSQAKDSRYVLVDGQYSPIKQFVFKDVTLESDFDFNNKTFVYDVEAQWKIGVRDYRGLLFSEGDNSTIST